MLIFNAPSMGKLVKYCFVPTCKMNSKISPNKKYFCIPELSKAEWCNAVGKNKVSKAKHFVCENHLNLEVDLKNYRQFKLGFTKRGILNNTMPKGLQNINDQTSRQALNLNANLNIINSPGVNFLSGTDLSETDRGKAIDRNKVPEENTFICENPINLEVNLESNRKFKPGSTKRGILHKIVPKGLQNIIEQTSSQAQSKPKTFRDIGIQVKPQTAERETMCSFQCQQIVNFNYEDDDATISQEDTPAPMVKQECPLEPQSSRAAAGAAMVKHKCPEEPQMSGVAAGAGEVKEEPADGSVDKHWERQFQTGCDVTSTFKVEVSPFEEGSSECSEDEAIPLIDIVKCEPTLIQTLDDGLSTSRGHCSGTDSTPASAYGEKRTKKKNIKDNNVKKPFKCDICKKRFTLKWFLNRHMLAHAKQHKCDICNKMFGGKWEPHQHKNTHSQVVHYKCDICNRIFNWKSSLITHIKIHYQLRQWKCDICHKGFKRKCHLNDHKNIHTKGKEHKCEVCYKMYKHEKNLRQHKKTHTKQNMKL